MKSNPIVFEEEDEDSQKKAKELTGHVDRQAKAIHVIKIQAD